MNLTDPNSGSTTILRARRLRKSFGGQIVLAGVDLDARCGEVVLLRGDNGSGKTTLIDILSGGLTPDTGVVELRGRDRSRSFRFPRTSWRAVFSINGFCPEGLAREGIGRTWQDVRLFGTQTVCDNIAVASPGQLGENPLAVLFRPFRVSSQEKSLRCRVQGALTDIGMEDRCKSSADKISLGQARRVAILRAVHSGARILFLDEPLAGLDPSGSEAVIYLLKTLARTHKLTIVLVEHVLNIPRVLEFADTVWTLAEGRLSVNTAAEVRTELTEQGWRGLSWLREIVGCSGLLKDECLPGGAILRRMSCTQSGDVVLELSDVVVHRGARLVVGQPLADNISGVSLSLQKGEVAVLQAPNGWGKTTLMEAAAGLLPLTQGTIRLQGKPINGCSPWERRRLGLSLLQARGHNFSSLTVEEALRLNGVKEIPEFLRELSTRRTAQLSGGEKQRLAFASAIHDGTYVVGLLDEPFSALDQQSLKYLLHILKVLLPTHGILIAVPGSHELQAQKEHAL